VKDYIAPVSSSIREAGRVDEIRHWREFCGSTRFRENFCEREPNPEIDQDVELFIKGCAAVQNAHGQVPKVLDIGSGPVSMLSRSFAGEKVDLYAADPLADDYAQLWDSSSYSGLVLPIACSAEELSTRFENDEFDITHIRNALDHVANPLTALDEMLKVTKPGGFLIVHGFANEAIAENWQGFHQWNLCWADGNDFTVSGKSGETHSIAAFFGDRARIMRPWMRVPAGSKAWCGFIAQKF
jgi:SAM-dependent methyltransferase